MTENKKAFLLGMKHGIPIGLGYLTVAFSLGIAAKNSGLNAVQGFIASMVTLASAGEYAAFRVIGENAPYIEMVLMILVANCRYLLMSCAMSQRTRPGESLIHRIGMGTFITDEIFGISITQENYLNPFYTYGAAAVSVLPWSLGTSLGIIAGDILPAVVVSALSVSLYGMFIAIIIPPSKKNRTVLCLVFISFAVSFAGEKLPYISSMGSGLRTVIFTVLIAGTAAFLFPVKDGEKEADSDAE